MAEFLRKGPRVKVGRPFNRAFKGSMPSGDLGSLHYIRQIHRKEDQSIPPGFLESQQAVLDALLVLKPRNVFVEGHSKDFRFRQTNAQSASVKNYFTDVKKHFDGYKAGTKFRDLSGAQKRVLMTTPPGGTPGGASIYCCLFQDATIRATQSERTRNVVSQFHVSGGENIKKKIRGKASEIFYDREIETVSFVNKFFRKNPRQNAALVFGLSHDFSQHSRLMPGVRFHDHAEMPSRPVYNRISIAENSQERPDPCNKDQVDIWRKAGNGYTPARFQPINGSVTYADKDGVNKFRHSGRKVVILDIDDIETIKVILNVVKDRNAGKAMDFSGVRGGDAFLRNVAAVAKDMGMKMTNVPDEYKKAYENGTAKLRPNFAAVKPPESLREPLGALRQGRVMPSRDRYALTQTAYGRK